MLRGCVSNLRRFHLLYATSLLELLHWLPIGDIDRLLLAPGRLLEHLRCLNESVNKAEYKDNTQILTVPCGQRPSISSCVHSLWVILIIAASESVDLCNLRASITIILLVMGSQTITRLVAKVGLRWSVAVRDTGNVLTNAILARRLEE